MKLHIYNMYTNPVTYAQTLIKLGVKEINHGMCNIADYDISSEYSHNDTATFCRQNDAAQIDEDEHTIHVTLEDGGDMIIPCTAASSCYYMQCGRHPMNAVVISDATMPRFAFRLCYDGAGFFLKAAGFDQTRRLFLPPNTKRVGTNDFTTSNPLKLIHILGDTIADIDKNNAFTSYEHAGTVSIQGHVYPADNRASVVPKAYLKHMDGFFTGNTVFVVESG